MFVTLRNEAKRAGFAALLAAGALAAALPSRAADPQTDARSVVSSMAEAVLATLRAGADKAAREARFRAMYQRNFDNAGIAAWAAGRAFAAASPAVKQEYLATFETYVVKAYAAQLARYKGERLRVDKAETQGTDIIVISNLVPPDPRDPREIEMRWRLHPVSGKLRVSDVVIDKISMALTEKRAFADWLKEKGGTLEGLTAKLKEKIAAADQGG
ncbi:MAG TPA: ABC transporter substrate-binding protein [Alphaproteobacteria bacterium]|jgi:phospholipid transport system substrate-binding protein